MSADEEIAEIHGVDPTPIHHPVDDEAIASAVNEAAAEVGDHDHPDDGGDGIIMDEEDPHPNSSSNVTTIVEQEPQPDAADGEGHTDSTTAADAANTTTTTISPDDGLPPSDLYSPDNPKTPKKRSRRVGKVAVVRKVPKLSEVSSASVGVVMDPTVPPPPIGEVEGGTETAAAAMATELIPRVLSKHDEKWNGMFKELLDFKDKQKTTNVPQCHGESPRLGRWVHYQRVEYWVFQDTGGGKITPERIARLEAIGFEWDPQRAQWNQMFEKLHKFAADTGHCKVPKGYNKDPELANWVRNQRLEHANMSKGKKSRMTDDRFKKLDDLGFKWSGTTAKGRTPAAATKVTATKTLEEAATTAGTGEDASSKPEEGCDEMALNEPAKQETIEQTVEV